MKKIRIEKARVIRSETHLKALLTKKKRGKKQGKVFRLFKIAIISFLIKIFLITISKE